MTSKAKEIRITSGVSTHNLFFGVLVGREQVDRLHVAEVDVMSEEEDEEEFADVLLLL